MAGMVTKSRADIAGDNQVADQVVAVAGDWAILTDGQQWILARRYKDGKWRGMSYVHSTRDVLERCVRERGIENALAAELLAGLPETFDQWKAAQACPQPDAAATADGSLP
jgi:hypothetical protein